MSNEFDLEKYRKPYDLEDHWQIKKAFIEKYIDDFPEGKLLCLAQLCVNVETLGVNYGKEVMEELERLTSDVPYIAEWRETKEKLDSERINKKKELKKRRHEERNERGDRSGNQYGNYQYGGSRNQNNWGQARNHGNSGYQSRGSYQTLPQSYNRQPYSSNYPSQSHGAPYPQSSYVQASSYNSRHQTNHNNPYAQHNQDQMAMRRGFQPHSGGRYASDYSQPPTRNTQQSRSAYPPVRHDNFSTAPYYNRPPSGSSHGWKINQGQQPPYRRW